MRVISILIVGSTIAACGKSASPDTVQSLSANPDRLQEVQRHCKEDPAKMGEACNAASEAFRRRFMGNGQAQYTPESPPKN
jgi:hypothetical protein